MIRFKQFIREEVKRQLNEIQPDKEDEVLSVDEVPRHVINALGTLNIRSQYVDRFIKQHLFGGNLIIVELGISGLTLTPDNIKEAEKMGLRRVKITDRYDPVLTFEENI